MTYIWKKEEVDLLYWCAGEVPSQILQEYYNYHALRRKLRTRGQRAIERKCVEFGLSVISVGEWISTGYIADTLYIHRNAVRQWIALAGLKAKKFTDAPRARWYVKRSDLRDFARKHPEKFNSYPPSRLLLIFDREKFAEEIAATKETVRPNKHKTAIMCVETREKFSSIAEASRKKSIKYSQIKSAVRFSTRLAGGLHWKPIETKPC